MGMFGAATSNRLALSTLASCKWLGSLSFNFFFFFFCCDAGFCYKWAFSNCGERGYSLLAGFSRWWLLLLHSTGSRASGVAMSGLCCSLGCGKNLPRPGTESMPPTLPGGFSTTGPPGKSWAFFFRFKCLRQRNVVKVEQLTWNFCKHLSFKAFWSHYALLNSMQETGAKRKPEGLPRPSDSTLSWRQGPGISTFKETPRPHPHTCAPSSVHLAGRKPAF